MLWTLLKNGEDCGSADTLATPENTRAAARLCPVLVDEEAWQRLEWTHPMLEFVNHCVAIWTDGRACGKPPPTRLSGESRNPRHR